MRIIKNWVFFIYRGNFQCLKSTWSSWKWNSYLKMKLKDRLILVHNFSIWAIFEKVHFLKRGKIFHSPQLRYRTLKNCFAPLWNSTTLITLLARYYDWLTCGLCIIIHVPMGPRLSPSPAIGGAPCALRSKMVLN